MSILYDIIYILPFSLLFVMLTGSYAGIPAESLSACGVCLLCSFCLILLRHMPPGKRLRSIGIAAVFLIVLLLAAGEENREYFIGTYGWVFPVFGFSVLALAAGLLVQRHIWFGRAAAALLLGNCIACVVLARQFNKAAFALTGFLLLVHIAEEIQRRWAKSGCTDRKEHITRIAPFFLAVSLIAYAAPAPDTPYDWQFAKDLYDGAAFCTNKICGFLAHPSDDYGAVGFSDSGGFLAGVSGSDADALTVEISNPAIRSFRLAGCVSGDFSGREWAFDTGTESCMRLMDTMETISAVRKYDTAFETDYLRKTDLQCESLFYNTHYLFSPDKIRLEITKEKTAGIGERNGSVISEKRLTYKDGYLISCYILNYSNPELASLLRSAEPISEAEWNEAMQAEHVPGQAAYSYAAYQDYRSMVSEKYCRPVAVSPEVRAILDEIQSRSSDRYETLKNLEAYLHSMEYTTDCGPLPETVTDAESFLDYFLLTSRKGYCMHYATAFVLMANAMEIPCRYVQGFPVRKEAEGSVLVKQSQAHAWPEAYFENAGWVTFEPTPGYSVPLGWGARKHLIYDPLQEQSQPETDVPAVPETVPEDGPAADLRIVIFAALAALGFLLLCILIGHAVSRGRYRRMSIPDRFRHTTQLNLRLLKKLGCPMAPDETLTEYRNRLHSSDREELKAHTGFITQYETALYSGCEVTAAELNEAEQTHRALRALAAKRRLPGQRKTT